MVMNLASRIFFIGLRCCRSDSPRCRMIDPHRRPSIFAEPRTEASSATATSRAAVLTLAAQRGFQPIHGCARHVCATGCRHTKHMLRLRSCEQDQLQSRRADHPAQFAPHSAIQMLAGMFRFAARTVWCAATPSRRSAFLQEATSPIHVIEGAYEVLHGFEASATLGAIAWLAITLDAVGEASPDRR